MKNMTVEFIHGETHIIDKEAKHSYAVETKVCGQSLNIYVGADSRTQAAARVRKLGYEVCSVNMEG